MLLAVLTTIAAASAASAPAPFTLDQVLAAPFPTGLVAARGHAKVAWVMNAKGVRNIWVAEGPDYQGRALTTFTEDDGEDLHDLLFTADAAAVVFVRGGSPNRAREIPNPRNRAEPRESALHVVGLDGSSRRLAEGYAPTTHPTENRVTYLYRNEVFDLELDEGKTARRLFAARGGVRSLRYSPDGSLLAFVSDRGTHSFIGVYDFAAKAVRFLDPGVDRDSEPVFSRDGKSLAFLRLAAQKERSVFGAAREGEPWSVRVADVATGQGREVFRAERGQGSVFSEIVAENQILWVGQHLVFPWEKTGFRHLYSVPAAGGAVVALTQGSFEVEHVTEGPADLTVIFSSNQDDIDRRHLWAVPAAGGNPARLTSGDGIQWSPVATSDGALAYFRSSANIPAHPSVRVGGDLAGREMAKGSIPAAFPSALLVEPEAVTVTATDGMKIPAQLFRPRGQGASEKRPAVIFFHGGSRRQMLLGFHYMSYYHHTYAMNQYLAGLGYVVLSVNFRSGTGYGMEFREALDYGPTGASEYADVVGAANYLRGRTDVDAAKIGLWGGSYGGFLTALGLARNSDLFAAGVDIHGCHDWNVVIKNFQPDYNPLEKPEAARLAWKSSPLADVKTWRSPVLLVHGDDDRNVPFSETVTLAEALRQQGVPFEILVFPDDVHSFLLHANWLATFERSAVFLDRYLKPPKSGTAR